MWRYGVAIDKIKRIPIDYSWRRYQKQKDRETDRGKLLNNDIVGI